MRIVSVRYRTFVHATENEDRVREALLWLMGTLGQERAEDRVERRRVKGHHGNEILVLEAGLKSSPQLEGGITALLGAQDVRQTLRDTLGQRLDEEHVLHFRVDKQGAVQRRLRLTAGGDAIIVQVKGLPDPGENPVAAWARFLLPAPKNV